MIKVHYDIETTLVKGYYPDSVNYSSIPEPYIEIKDEDQVFNTQMCVINGIYQKSKEMILQEAKQAKLNELYRFHESNEVKYLTIRIGNLKTGILVNQEYRYLIDEQRELLQIKKLKGDPNPVWDYVNGVTLPLTLEFLNNLRLYIGDLTDFNFKAKINNVKLINNLKTKDDVENFNVKNGYRFNQEFTV